MDWYHECSKDWMKARSNYLTASSISKLLPVTPIGRKRDVAKSSLEIYAKMHQTSFDNKSYGAAARGHIMEPYAVRAFNEIGIAPIMYHWDDAVIHNKLLAFSPDGLNVSQEELPIFDYNFDDMEIKPTAGVEIKSYSVDKHLLCGISNPLDLEERWQIATAFKVASTLEDMYLVLFNPSASKKMFVHHYTRKSLEAELKIIEVICKNFIDFLINMDAKKIYNAYDIPSWMSEESIFEAEMNKGIINP